MVSLQLQLLLIFLFGSNKARTLLEEETSVLAGNDTSFGIRFNFSEFEFTFSWNFKGKSILVHDPHLDGHETRKGKYTSVMNNNGTLISLGFQNVQFADAGKYTCAKIFVTAGKTEEGSFMLKVQGRPELEISSTKPTEGDAIWAKCCVEYSKESADEKIEWSFRSKLHNFSVNSTNSEISSGKEKNTLCDTITFSAERSHHGNSLHCIVESSLNAFSSVVMHVRYSSTVRVAGPISLLIDEKSDINITCVSEGNPLPIVNLQYHLSHDKWSNRKVGKITMPRGETSTVTIFHYNNISRDHAGIYRCSAFNQIGLVAVSRVLQVKVMYLDEVEMLTPSPYLVGNAGTIKISCRVHGNAFSDVKLQANIGKDYWVSLQLNAYNISKEAGFSTWQYHFSEEFYHVTNFRCVANSTEGAFIASKGLIVKYQSLFHIIKDMTLNNLEIAIAFLVGTIIAATLICVKCKRNKTTPFHPHVVSESQINRGNTTLAGDSYTSTYPLVPTIRRPIPAPPISEENNESTEGKNENNDELTEYQTRGPVQNEDSTSQNDVSTVKYATVSK